MSPSTLPLSTVGIIIGASLGFAQLSSRAFDRKYPPKLSTDSIVSSRP